MTLGAFAAIPMALQGLGAGMDFMSSIYSAKIAYTGAKMKAAAEEFNGAIQGLALQEKAAKWQVEGIKMHSTQVVAGAAAGIDLSSHSFQLLQQETTQNFMNDAQRMRQAGVFTAAIAAVQAQGTRAMGRAERDLGYLNAASGLLNSAGKMFNLWGGMGGT